MKSSSHDLEMLVKQATAKMAADYERMRRLAREDSGTSGDQAEEEWAALLSHWLPATYHVARKGRIIFSSGETSGQIDLLILSPSYPKGLLSNKLYLAAGVLAALECKRTLRRQNIRAAVQASVRLSNLARSDPRVRHHIIYGLLAHSHGLASKRNPPETVLAEALNQADAEEVTDPRDGIDLICVPPLGTWSLMRAAFGRPEEADDIASDEQYFSTCYMRGPLEFGSTPAPDAIGRFLTGLLQRLGKVDRSISPIADYFQGVGLFGVGFGKVRSWRVSAMSKELRNALSSEEYYGF